MQGTTVGGIKGDTIGRRILFGKERALQELELFFCVCGWGDPHSTMVPCGC